MRVERRKSFHDNRFLTVDRVALIPRSGRYRRGGPVALLLPEPGLPRLWPAGTGNLTVCGRSGKTQPHRLFDCRTCKDRFAERKGTPLFGVSPPEEKAIDLLKHLADRTGVRATARRVGVHRDTVVRSSRRVGEHARQLHDELVAVSPSDRRGPAR